MNMPQKDIWLSPTFCLSAGVMLVMTSVVAAAHWIGLLPTAHLPRLLAFVASSSLLIVFFYLRFLLHWAIGREVMPEHVGSALDSLGEGVVIIDREGRIVFANQMFRDWLPEPRGDLVGMPVNRLCRLRSASTASDGTTPWSACLNGEEPSHGHLIELVHESGNARTLRLNAATLRGAEGAVQGVLLSFNDVADVKKDNETLVAMLESLQQSRDHIHQQNEELRLLATKDPLTAVLNRRAFLEQFERIWDQALRYHEALSCVMIDVDRFKWINDRFGHSIGDQVLQRVAAILHETVRESDLVCRYGGEEFCLLLPHTDQRVALQAAERCRHAIEQADFGEIKVTISVGVSSLGTGAESPHSLMNQADRSLYTAKRRGRNCVVAWADIASDEDEEPRNERPHTPQLESHKADANISFQAVTALMSALAFRDAATADHSRRVAELCAAVCHDLIPAQDAYLVEIAALLHDVGKIGVPDDILLKPGPLNETEWRVMRAHERIGIEILRSTFSCELLTAIVTMHHAKSAEEEAANNRQATPIRLLGAGVLKIADAYDSMVSDKTYRKGRSPADAIAELRGCAGHQFKAELVERVVDIVTTRDALLPNVDLPAVLHKMDRQPLELPQQTPPPIDPLANHIDTVTA